MESFGCGLSISNVHSIIEEADSNTTTWDVNIKEECNLDVENHDENVPVIVKSETTVINSEDDDTLSVTEPQVEIEYSEVALEYCGLPNLKMFKSLLEYIEDEIEPMQGTTKFSQLFSVLTKLHTNQEGIYLNKYTFPSTFVQIIELLYKKLKVLCKLSTPSNKIPTIFTPEFTRNQELIIIGAITLHTLDKSSVLKYLIGYSAFGEVFFVSNSFLGFTPIDELIQYSGILEELQPEQWILYFKDNLLYTIKVRYIKDKILGSRLDNAKIEKYTSHVNKKLKQHFLILSQPVLDSMLFSKGDICFLDKLIFVCCMLLNMLPRSTYH